MNSQNPIVGGLYASRNASGQYLIVKVLVADSLSVHVRMYAERFNSLPTAIKSSQLSLGSLSTTGATGIGHVPLSREGFLHDERILLAQESISEEELEGYRYWAGEE